MEQTPIDRLAELLLISAKLAAAGQKLSAAMSRVMQLTLAPDRYQLRYACEALAEWDEAEVAYHALCSELWTQPEKQVTRPGWDANKCDDVVKAMREGRI